MNEGYISLRKNIHEIGVERLKRLSSFGDQHSLSYGFAEWFSKRLMPEFEASPLMVALAWLGPSGAVPVEMVAELKQLMEGHADTPVEIARLVLAYGNGWGRCADGGGWESVWPMACLELLRDARSAGQKCVQSMQQKWDASIRFEPQDQMEAANGAVAQYLSVLSATEEKHKYQTYYY